MLRKIYFCQLNQARKLYYNNSYLLQIIIALNSITKYFVKVKLSCLYQILKINIIKNSKHEIIITMSQNY